MLTFFSLPRLGFCEISELLIVPDNLIGNWQLSLGAMVMEPVDFSPQLASVTDIEHSEAASAKGAVANGPGFSGSASSAQNPRALF